MDILHASKLNAENPAPGIYTGVKDSVYFAVNAANNSELTWIINETPAHYKFYKDNPDDNGSKSKDLGTAAHVAVLQPERLKDEVKLIPGYNKNTNKFHQALVEAFPDAPVENELKWAENFAIIKQHYPDMVVTEPKVLQQAEAMAKKLHFDDKQFGEWRFHTIANEGRVEAEVVLIWNDERTGILCKAKFDLINFDLLIGLDYKTAADASPQKFRYSISDYGYHRQLAHYYRGARACGIPMEKNAILAQESKPPYISVWYEFDLTEQVFSTDSTGEEWQIANFQLDQALETLALCREEDEWPGYFGRNRKNILPIRLKYDDYREFREHPFREDHEIDLPFKDEDKTETETGINNEK